MPVPLPENLIVLNDQGVRGDPDVPFILVPPALALLFPLLLSTIIRQDLEAWEEFLEFHFPIEHDTCGHNDQVRAPCLVGDSEVSQERYGLDRFAKTHLVRQNAIGPISVELCKPVKANMLILP